MEKLTVSLVTPQKQVVKIDADMVTAPSVMGEVGILPNHRALLAGLQEGPVLIKNGDKAELYAVSGGFIEVDRNQVTLLAETAEHKDQIDLDRSKAALKDAEHKLTKLDFGTPEYEEQWARVKRAKVRLMVASGK